MVYRFAVDRADYGDLASGAVLRSAPGFPAFPVRLASEMFQRAAALRGGTAPLTVWDPCCGSGYLLTVVGLLHRDRIGTLVGSDVAEDAIGIAASNLSLLHRDGLAARESELAELAERHGRPSHREAAEAARRLAADLAGAEPRTITGTASVFDVDRLRRIADEHRPDVVLTDVPYGEQTDWTGAPTDGEPIAAMVAAIAEILPPGAVIAVSCRARKVPLGVPPTQSFKVGTRSVALLKVSD